MRYQLVAKALFNAVPPKTANGLNSWRSARHRRVGNLSVALAGAFEGVRLILRAYTRSSRVVADSILHLATGLRCVVDLTASLM